MNRSQLFLILIPLFTSHLYGCGSFSSEDDLDQPDVLKCRARGIEKEVCEQDELCKLHEEEDGSRQCIINLLAKLDIEEEDAQAAGGLQDSVNDNDDPEQTMTEEANQLVSQVASVVEGELSDIVMPPSRRTMDPAIEKQKVEMEREGLVTCQSVDECKKSDKFTDGQHKYLICHEANSPIGVCFLKCALDKHCENQEHSTQCRVLEHTEFNACQPPLMSNGALHEAAAAGVLGALGATLFNGDTEDTEVSEKSKEPELPSHPVADDTGAVEFRQQCSSSQSSLDRITSFERLEAELAGSASERIWWMVRCCIRKANSTMLKASRVTRINTRPWPIMRSLPADSMYMTRRFASWVRIYPKPRSPAATKS